MVFREIYLVLGITFLILSIIFLLLYSISFLKEEKKEKEEKVGGLVIIGPIVIPFGEFTKYKEILIFVSIALIILYIIMIIK